MTISIISNFLNIGGNAILIFGLGMGVAGAALSTLASRVFCAVVVIIKLRNPSQTICVNRYYTIRPDWDLIKRVLYIGIPSGIENSMSSLESWQFSQQFQRLELLPLLQML